LGQKKGSGRNRNCKCKCKLSKGEKGGWWNDQKPLQLESPNGPVKLTRERNCQTGKSMKKKMVESGASKAELGVSRPRGKVKELN